MAGAESRVLDVIATAIPLTALTLVERQAFERLDLIVVTEWVRFIFPEMKNNPNAGALAREFLKRVSASEHTLSDWLERVLITYRWLDARESRAHLSDVVEYAACALHGSQNPDGRDVSWYLEQFGFERSWRV